MEDRAKWTCFFDLIIGEYGLSHNAIKTEIKYFAQIRNLFFEIFFRIMKIMMLI